MTNKPLPPVRVEPNPFGEFSEEQLNGAPAATDKFYLSGYSDKRQARELATRERDKSAGAPKPAALDRRFQYVSDTSPTTGMERRDKITSWIARGYRIVKYDELAALGIDAEKSTCERGVGGEARVASQVLMVCDAPTAAYHYNQNQELIANQFRVNVEEPLQEAGDHYNERHGRTGKSGTRITVDTKVSKTPFELE